MRVVLLLLVPLLAGCISNDPVPAEDVQTGQIDGAVLDFLLNPYGNATVVLVELGRSDQTSHLGGFSFRHVPIGAYTLRASVGGVTGAETVLVVRDGETTRTILQVPRPEVPWPHVTTLRHEGTDDLGVPGAECLECSWTTEVPDDPPRHLRLEARWDDTFVETGAATRIRVELHDQSGRTVTSMEGRSPLITTLMGSSLPPDARTLEVRVRMHETNEAAHPGVTVATSLLLYHHVDPE